MFNTSSGQTPSLVPSTFVPSTKTVTTTFGSPVISSFSDTTGEPVTLPKLTRTPAKTITPLVLGDGTPVTLPVVSTDLPSPTVTAVETSRVGTMTSPVSLPKLSSLPSPSTSPIKLPATQPTPRKIDTSSVTKLPSLSIPQVPSPKIVDTSTVSTVLPAPEVTVPSSSNIRIDNIDTNVVTAEQILFKYGYNVISKVVIKEAQGMRSEFIKCLNPIGIIVYVRVDSNTYVSVDSDKMRLVKQVESMDIPYSYKTSLYDKTFPVTDGLAVECNDGVCFVLGSGDVDNLQVHNYSYVDGAGSSISNLTNTEYFTNNMLSMPIVDIKSIEVDPVGTLSQSEIVHQRLVEFDVRSCHTDIKSFDASYVEMGIVGKHTIDNILRYDNILSSTTYTARQYAKEYLAHGINTDEQERKYRILLYNLKKREELRATMVKCCRVFANMSVDIDKVTQELKRLTEFTDSSFSDVGGTMTGK